MLKNPAKAIKFYSDTHDKLYEMTMTTWLLMQRHVAVNLSTDTTGEQVSMWMQRDKGQTMKQLRDRSYPIFEEVRSNLMYKHYNWFIAIEPENGDYFIDPDDLTCSKKLLQKYPNANFYMFRLNETGVCYKL